MKNRVELKKIKYYPGLSQETNSFAASVYFDGTEVAHAQNSGTGGCTTIYPIQGKRDLFDRAVAYVKSQPPVKFGEYTWDMTMELMIDTLLDEYIGESEKKKLEKKFNKLFLNHIVWGVPGGDSYHKISFKGNPMFADVVKTPNGKVALENLVNRVKSQLKEGQVIFNNNI